MPYVESLVTFLCPTPKSKLQERLGWVGERGRKKEEEEEEPW